MTSQNNTEGGTNVLLQPFAKNVWIVDGPVVDFYGFAYPTRMVVIKLSEDSGGGGAWIWSPITLTEELAIEITETVGPVACLVSPNAIHWLFMKPWQERFPDSKMYASPGLANRKIASDLKFDGGTLTNDTPDDYKQDIDQAIFQGGVLDEVVFFHKASKTVIFCDLIQRHPVGYHKGFHGWIMKAEGVVGPTGSTPKEWIFAFWAYGKMADARQTLDKVLKEWQPDKLIIAHGENATENATVIIENCLPWIPPPSNETNNGCNCCWPQKQQQTHNQDAESTDKEE